MISAIDAVAMPYSSFQQASNMLADLQPIDYFFAEHVCQTLATTNALVFHLAIATHQSLQQGHSCLPLSVVAERTMWQIKDSEALENEKAGFSFGSLAELTSVLGQFPELLEHTAMLVLDNQHLYLRRYYLFEQQLRQYLTAKLNNHNNISTEQIKSVVNQLFTESAEQAIDWQKVAVANALNKDFVVIAGGPGTGKTYTVTKLLAALIMLHQQTEANARLNIALTAPTGKAAQRLSESILAAIKGFTGQIDQAVLDEIPSQAQTIHRLLGVRPNSVNFKYHQDNLLPIDVLLVDEASMIDLALMTRIFRALPNHTKVILLGDADQLPSVASGSVLADIAPRPHRGFSPQNSAFLSTVLAQDVTSLTAKDPSRTSDHLTILQHSRRFDGQGGIGVVAKHVINGEAKASWQRLVDDQSGQVGLITQANMSWLDQHIQQYYQPLLTMTDISQAFAQLSQFRILVAMRKGQLGVENINELVVKHLVEQQLIDAGQAYKKSPLYHGMPIMITENHHKLGLYNGDIGLIWQQGEQLVAIFEQVDGFKTVIPSRLPSYELVYAMTIHKTQGSEFTHVLMALPENTNNKLLTRELLYTGITRAKKQLSIVGDFDVWQQGVQAKVVRYSQLTL
ncbi:exodeoxyribonuclease V subunit alpha [Thalassotalea sp. LPB0316]|uniref:exodeoxyribonuclease V subunit alpha n=1 Tax=Thalassotalea sp. LPB0316 TaxID=2769490 RepID=UPI001868A44F|nr:exodeoxyribonuclease V subunit alpha [Thalassotalea sp. LPB0316]QOL24945.1 exodeoxyribonuclease V subunit alpha [Thalassotalea sp. LPB0316]